MEDRLGEGVLFRERPSKDFKREDVSSVLVGICVRAENGVEMRMASMGRSVRREAERMLIQPASTRPLWTAKTVSDGEAETASVSV